MWFSRNFSDFFFLNKNLDDIHADNDTILITFNHLLFFPPADLACNIFVNNLVTSEKKWNSQFQLFTSQVLFYGIFRDEFLVGETGFFPIGKWRLWITLITSE